MPAPFVLLDTSLTDATVGDEHAVPDETRHHLTRVLRLRDGAQVEVSDGHGHRAVGVLTAEGVRLVTAAEEDQAPATTIHVLQGLPRGRKQDEVVRMLTELGVDRVTAVIADRTQSPSGAKAAKATARWAAVARAACEQARRSRLPRVDEPMTLDVALDGLAPGSHLLAAHLGATVDPLAALPADQPAAVAIAVGPEGGWSPAEASRLEEAGAVLVSLGQSVLRTEHAALVLAAVVAAATGRMAVPAVPWD